MVQKPMRSQGLFKFLGCFLPGGSRLDLNLVDTVHHDDVSLESENHVKTYGIPSGTPVVPWPRRPNMIST